MYGRGHRDLHVVFVARDTLHARRNPSFHAFSSRRIEQASKFVPLDQICLSPQCGFASSEEGNIIAEDEQWAKLRMVVELAEEIWGGR